jgi:putative addiction module killer protein
MKVQYYITENGIEPVVQWLDSLRDKKTKARIASHIGRMRHGNFGDSESVGGGVSELKIDFGPGYRVYYAKSGTEIVLLLCAGTKKSQDKDIDVAKEYWEDFKERKKKEK